MIAYIFWTIFMKYIFPLPTHTPKKRTTRQFKVTTAIDAHFEQKIIIEFLTAEGISPTEIHHRMMNVHRPLRVVNAGYVL